MPLLGCKRRLDIRVISVFGDTHGTGGYYWHAASLDLLHPWDVSVEFAKILFLNAKKLKVLDTLLTLNE